MKKVLFAIAMLCMVASSAFAQEEKGRMAVNVHAGISTTAGAQGLAGVEFRVAVADKWRLAPQFNIGGGHDLKFFDVTVDAHYVFNYENSNFSFYPIMGLGFDHYWQNTPVTNRRPIVFSSIWVSAANMPSTIFFQSQPK